MGEQKRSADAPEPSVSVEELVALVRDPEHAPPTISKPLQQAFTGVVTDTAMSAIKMGGMHQAGVTKDQVYSVVASAQEKVAETSVSVAKGTISGGARGGGAGLVSGSVIGAACGLIPAVFTFGLSIPIGAALGGGTGLVVGSSVGATAGAIGSVVGGRSLLRSRRRNRKLIKRIRLTIQALVRRILDLPSFWDELLSDATDWMAVRPCQGADVGRFCHEC